MLTFLFLSVSQDFVDFTAPPLWGIVNKASLFSTFNPRNVHAALHGFMLHMTSDSTKLTELQSFNFKMKSLWECAHQDPSSLPNILKEKRKSVVPSSKKHLRSQAAADVLADLWDSDYGDLKSLLKDHLLVAYPLPPATDASSSFAILFNFSGPPQVCGQLEDIGNKVVPRQSRSVKGTATAATEPPTDSKKVASAQVKSGQKTPSVMPAALSDFAELVDQAEHVYMQVAPVRKTWLAAKSFASPPKKPLKFHDLVQHMIMQLILKKADAILLGRIMFDYADPEDEDNQSISYSKAYVQPGVVTLPFDLDETGDNYLKCFWVPVSSSDGHIDIPAEISLQHVASYEPYVLSNSWDAVNPNPLALFSQQQWKRGLWFFTLPSDFGLDDQGVIPVQPPALTEQPPHTSSKKRSKEISSENNPKKKRTGRDTQSQLEAMKEQAMEGVEMLPRPIIFLDSNGNWPLCRTAKCKKTGKLAVYCEPEGRKPIHCTKCKSSMEVKSHFVNLKGYLQGKGKLDSFQVDRTDTEMCEIFGVPVEQSEEENSDINEDN